MIATLISLSIALAMDCFSIAVLTGTLWEDGNHKNFGTIISRLALAFGGFQAGMYAIGFRMGITIVDYIERWDHWIAFVILLFLGIKMIIGAKDDSFNIENIYSLKGILGLSLATSMDALASGVACMSMADWFVTATILIGLGSFVLTILGGFLGRWIKRKMKNLKQVRFDVLGGVFLILIGIKILCEHELRL